MTTLIRRVYLLATLSSSILTFGQSGSPQAALEEMATADNLETVLRHLPPALERSVRQMSTEQRARIESELLIQNKLKAEGTELQRGSDGSTWVLTGPDDVEDTNSAPAAGRETLITIQHPIQNGTDALVIIDVLPEASATSDQAQRQPSKRESALVRMKFEDGEW